MYKFIILLKKIYWALSNKIGFAVLIRDERKSIHSDKLKRYKTVTGNYYLPKYAYQDVIRREIIKNRIFDRHVYELGKKFVRPNTTIIDAGANYGQMSILFSKVQPNTIVYSFEASNYIFNILEKNISINSENIKAINCILSDKSGEEYLEKPNLKKFGTYGALNLELSNANNKDKIKTIMRRIDDFNYEKKISLMKIDVQGWDLKVLKGSLKTINKYRMPIIFEYEDIFEEEMNYTFESYLHFFKEIDYKFKTSINGNFLVLPKEHC